MLLLSRETIIRTKLDDGGGSSDSGDSAPPPLPPAVHPEADPSPAASPPSASASSPPTPSSEEVLPPHASPEPTRVRWSDLMDDEAASHSGDRPGSPPSRALGIVDPPCMVTGPASRRRVGASDPRPVPQTRPASAACSARAQGAALWRGRARCYRSWGVADWSERGASCST